jgi:hypothetical protein
MLRARQGSLTAHTERRAQQRSEGETQNQAPGNDRNHAVSLRSDEVSRNTIASGRMAAEMLAPVKNLP